MESTGLAIVPTDKNPERLAWIVFYENRFHVFETISPDWLALLGLVGEEDG